MWDLRERSVRELNYYLHHNAVKNGITEVQIFNPDGAHHIAVGLDAPIKVDILGNAGYFVGGMNKQAHITVHGNVGWSVAENIMSGVVRVKGYASECAGASGHGGLLVIEKDASSRCGISMKGNDIVVGGSVGHFSAFMAQAGHLVVCGNAGDGLGDSLYEAVIYVRGEIRSLGADAQEEPMAEDDYKTLAALLEKAGFKHHPEDFKRIASAKKLYHWNAEHYQEY
ncbi:glutamate synthase (NADPH) GltB3 subunit [Rubrobacter xylanophilus DSM 9941]|uniref:Glutamate synthase (NADPH) GltB3 subunit n=2 Tax=Rubrobacter xylanophilus TaxID=49319 RepID=Q1AT54_RUBXD|nr:glutamate synthase (NADPH) GltB3 subunit [Rubrobacter xylanophilus DSM 9941]